MAARTNCAGPERDLSSGTLQRGSGCTQFFFPKRSCSAENRRQNPKLRSLSGRARFSLRSNSENRASPPPLNIRGRRIKDRERRFSERRRGDNLRSGFFGGVGRHEIKRGGIHAVAQT